MKVPFTQLPDDARLWAYGLDRELTDAEIGKVTQILDAFMANWASHQAPVDGSYKLVDARFVVMAGQCADGVSGCSTDSSVHAVREIEAALDINAFDRSLVFFRNGGGSVVAVARSDFQELVTNGHVTDETIVFDTTITSVADFRGGRLETTFAKSWHAKAFKRSPV